MRRRRKHKDSEFAMTSQDPNSAWRRSERTIRSLQRPGRSGSKSRESLLMHTFDTKIEDRGPFSTAAAAPLRCTSCIRKNSQNTSAPRLVIAMLWQRAESSMDQLARWRQMRKMRSSDPTEGSCDAVALKNRGWASVFRRLSGRWGFAGSERALRYAY